MMEGRRMMNRYEPASACVSYHSQRERESSILTRRRKGKKKNGGLKEEKKMTIINSP
jgi:hypothetical protein